MKYFLIFLHHTSAVLQPFLLLIGANFALAGFLGWKWSLWPIPDWFEVQRIKDVFFLTLYDSINYVKYFLNVCITPQPCHSYFCCWLVPVWPKLDFWAENGAYGPIFSLTVSSMTLLKLSPSHLSRTAAILVVNWCQFGPSWIFGLKMELMVCADLVGGTT